LLRVALNTITLTLIVITMNWLFCFFTSCWFPTSWSNDNLNWNTTEVLKKHLRKQWISGWLMEHVCYISPDICSNVQAPPVSYILFAS
jgi:hypothetical protein